MTDVVLLVAGSDGHINHLITERKTETEKFINEAVTYLSERNAQITVTKRSKEPAFNDDITLQLSEIKETALQTLEESEKYLQANTRLVTHISNSEHFELVAFPTFHKNTRSAIVSMMRLRYEALLSDDPVPSVEPVIDKCGKCSETVKKNAKALGRVVKNGLIATNSHLSKGEKGMLNTAVEREVKLAINKECPGHANGVIESVRQILSSKSLHHMQPDDDRPVGAESRPVFLNRLKLVSFR